MTNDNITNHICIFALQLRGSNMKMQESFIFEKATFGQCVMAIITKHEFWVLGLEMHILGSKSGTHTQSFTIVLLRVSPPFYIYGYLFIGADSTRFLPFIPRASPTIFSLLWTSLHPPIHWLPDHYHQQVNPVHSLSSTIHSMTKSLFV